AGLPVGTLNFSMLFSFQKNLTFSLKPGRACALCGAAGIVCRTNDGLRTKSRIFQLCLLLLKAPAVQSGMIKF
ncbi:MAG: hypothetical protein Q7U14_02900, partial [Lacisediminimonas sp.]|nr:hypothetical protein [Lacisediminimonas sp.]